MDIYIPYTQFTLANGLNVIVHQDASLPVASVNVWYHVGSKNESPGRTGFAHLFEHLMFEGSGHVPEGRFDHLLESSGGSNNGSTTNDRTNYHENVPANALELALWLESDRMGWLLDTMTQEKLDLQRDVVKNERRQSVDNQPYGLAFEKVYERLYAPDHPYHWPVIGSMEDLSAATLDDVKDFFRTYYAPNNASLAIAGDVDVGEVRHLVETYFGDIPSGPPVPAVMVPEANLAADRLAVLEDAVQLPRLYVAWHGPCAFTADDASMEVLASVLADGKSARLYKRLVYDEQIAQDVTAFQDGMEVGGTFWIVATAKPDVALDRIAHVIREEVARVVVGGVAAVERDRAVHGVETGFVRSIERVGGFGGKADRLNEYHFLAGTPGYVRTDLERFRGVTERSVAEAGRRWLSGIPAVWLSVVPKGRTDLAVSTAEPNAVPVGSGAQDAGGVGGPRRPALDRNEVPLNAAPRAMTLPEVQDYQLDNGVRVILVERDALPLVSVELQFRGGASTHSTAKAGLAAFTADMLDEGTTTRSALELADAVDYLGGSLSSTAGYDANQLRLSVLRPHFADALDILGDVVMHPTFPDAEIERLRARRIARVLQRSDVPAALADDAFFEVLYGTDHPYGSSLLGTKESLESLTRDDMVAFHGARYAPGQATLVVVGDVKRVDLDALLADSFVGWSGHGDDAQTLTLPPAQGRTVYLIDKPGAAQSEIRIGRVAVDRHTADYFPITIANTVLGGSFTSRLNTKLREEKGYTYGAGSWFDMRRFAGPFEAAAAVDTSVTDRAVVEFVREVDRLHEETVPDEELCRARSYVALRLPQRFESIDDVARRLAEMALYNIPFAFYSGYVDGIERVDAAAVRRVATDWLQTDHMAVVVAGDRASIEEPLRALDLGPLVVLTNGSH